MNALILFFLFRKDVAAKMHVCLDAFLPGCKPDSVTGEHTSDVSSLLGSPSQD
jgi:hypothetical protein